MKPILPTIILLLLTGQSNLCSSERFVPADNPNIQYSGRWDMTSPARPRYSWSGISVTAIFSGTRIGVRLADRDTYYNVYIDGELYNVFHGDSAEEKDYILADSLQAGRHTLRFSKRNSAFDTNYVFAGLLLDEAGELYPPAPKPARRIEFIGDSFTVGEGNEATQLEMPWVETIPVTNLDRAFAPQVAAHFDADYFVTARSGFGMVSEWTGNRDNTLPARFDRALCEVDGPKWDFSQWVPDLVVIFLGLNDHGGLRAEDGSVSDENSAFFRQGYHDFLKQIRAVYPGARILAAAAFVEWIGDNVHEVVADEVAAGNRDIFYTQFDRFEGGYVANGHPSVAAHDKMAAHLIKVIEELNLFPDSERSSKGDE